MCNEKKNGERYIMWTTTTTFGEIKFSYIIKKEDKK